MNAEELRAIPKTAIPEAAKKLTLRDVNFLVETLSEKEDASRYNAFLLLQANSRLTPTVYAHWTKLEGKLGNSNSYQRSLGLMLLAENVRWDKDGRFDKVIDSYLDCCLDEKFVTARQAIQGFASVIEATDRHNDRIKQGLNSLDFAKYKEHQQRLLKKDVATILGLLDKKH